MVDLDSGVYLRTNRIELLSYLMILCPLPTFLPFHIASDCLPSEEFAAVRGGAEEKAAFVLCSCLQSPVWCPSAPGQPLVFVSIQLSELQDHPPCHNLRLLLLQPLIFFPGTTSYLKPPLQPLLCCSEPLTFPSQ